MKLSQDPLCSNVKYLQEDTNFPNLVFLYFPAEIENSGFTLSNALNTLKDG